MKLQSKRLFAAAAATALLVSGGAVVATTSATAAAATCSAYSGYAKMPGKTVEVFTSVIQPELQHYIDAANVFTACTGIKIYFNGTNSFESLLPVRVKGGTAPDLALIPQPGLVQAMVATGKAVPVPAQTQANVKKYWSPGWQAYATVNGKLYGSPNSANMKSLVWYSPKQFAADGFHVPTTWADMMTQSKAMAAAGYTPWCAGLGSGTATGWPATDWVEEVVLRQSGSTVYNNWISHKVKFSDAPIQSAMNTVASWLQDPSMVGNVPAIASTTFQAAGQSIPTAGKGSGCMQLQQASFYGAQYPSTVDVSPTGDVWAYYLPGINPAVHTPVEGGGEFYVAFNKNPATQEAQNFFSSPLWPIALIPQYGAAGGWTTANSGVPLSAYSAPLDKLAAKYLGDPKGTFVFDASDAMPAAVGTGTEWTDFTNWFAQGLSTKQVGAEIDASWPKQ